jgi:hypothetical protein
MSRWFVTIILFTLALAPVANAAGPAATQPVVPVGLDAYRQWDRWPAQRLGVRAYLRSTYDRRGGNEAADASHFLYQLADDRNVTLDLAGPGVLYFARYNHWHGSPWHYEVDGADYVVRETSTADPLHPDPGSVFLPTAAFPEPLTYTWAKTRGADLTWVPLPFEKSFRMAYGRTCYGTGYYIYHQFVDGTPLSRPIRAWDASPPADDVLKLIARSGDDLAPPEGAPGVEVSKGAATLSPGSSVPLAALTRPGVVRALKISAPRAAALDLARVRLRVTWDGRAAPSVDAPLPLFFGAGTLYNRDDREYLVRSFPVTVRFDPGHVELSCYFPMPFFRSAKFELVNDGDAAVPDLAWSVRVLPLTEPANHLAYFHATHRDIPAPERGNDMVLLDTKGAEGSADWSGSFVGTTYTFTHDNVLTTLEGDPRFFFDDSRTPQAQGTGSEEWGGGGDYWGGRTMTLPFVGHPVGAADAKSVKEPLDKLHSAYRFLLADLFPFGRNARIQLEHGGANESKEHYETVAYWYGLPAASLVETDSMQVGDAGAERAHDYRSPQASEPYEVTSRYEWGVDHVGKDEVFPAETDRGRTTVGTSEFTLKLDPANLGVMLRRKLDYQYPDQRAEVSVADASDPAAAVGEFRPAGVWYLAGSNTCVFSRPKGELDPAVHTVQTSNRRFRDDEFLLPRAVTEGRSAIRVRVRFTPVDRPLFPGHPLAPQAWSEIKYTCYCYVMPAFDPK